MSNDVAGALEIAKKLEDYSRGERLNLSVEEIAQAAALLRSPPVGEEWRPIESMPDDDDELVLAWVPDGRMMIFRCAMLRHARKEKTPNHLQFPATHWRPLPAPPGASQTRPAITEDVVERVARAIYFANRGEHQYRPDHPNEEIARKSLLHLERYKDRDPDTWKWICNEARAAIAAMTGEK